MLTSFNPRPRTGGDETAGADSPTPSMFQSAPPHGGRPDRRQVDRVDRDVSIRAPARGATRHGINNEIWLVVSIRAPARGATVGALNALKSHV